VSPRNDANASQIAFVRAEPGRVARDCRQQPPIPALDRPLWRLPVRTRSATHGSDVCSHPAAPRAGPFGPAVSAAAASAGCPAPGRFNRQHKLAIDSHLSTGYTGNGRGTALVPPRAGTRDGRADQAGKMERIVKLPLIVGAGIAALVLAAFIVSPQLRSEAAKTAQQARQQATLAERALHRYNYRLPTVGRLAPPEELKTADAADLAEMAKPGIEEGKKDLSKRLNEIRSQAQKAGLPPPKTDLPTADASGLKRSLGQYDQMLADNEQLLKQAAQEARAAKQAGSSVLGVSQVAGMVEYTRASRALAEASALRDAQQHLQAELRLANSQARNYEGSRDCAMGMEMAAVVSGLQNDLAEVEKLAAAATARAAELAARVSQREQELAPIKAEQDQVRDELLALENKGFTAGDDESFASYRAQFERLSTRARELQEQEELLRLGGLRGATFAGDDYQNAEIEGGEQIVSLEMLREAAAAAQEAAMRGTQAVEELRKQIKTAEQSGRDAQAAVERYTALVASLEARQAELWPQIEDLAEKAGAKEDEALKAASDAASAFRSSQQAADGWLREARDLQSERDPERVNPRLKMMLDDKGIPSMGSSAEAEALVLMGRIYAQRIEANRALLADLRQLHDGGEEAHPAAEKLQEQIESDVAEATEKLQSAIKLYEGVMSKVKPETKWVPQAALAGVYTLLARINPAEAAAHMSDALARIQESTGGRERSPYVQKHVEFQEHIRQTLESGEQGAAAEKPAKVEPEAAEAPAEEEPAGEGD